MSVLSSLAWVRVRRRLPSSGRLLFFLRFFFFDPSELIILLTRLSSGSGIWTLSSYLVRMVATATDIQRASFFFFFSHRRSVKSPRTRASRAPSRGKWPGALRRGSLRQVVNRRPGLAPAEAIDVVVVPIFIPGLVNHGSALTLRTGE